MNPPPAAQQVTAPQRLAAHLNTVLYLQYTIIYVVSAKAITALQSLQQINLPKGDLFMRIMYFFPS
jgi:hypothetical protein